MMIKTIAFLACLAAVLSVAEAQCQTFYEGLCPGPADCMCTLGEACGTRRNISEVRTAAGGCGGQCRLVAHNECGGGNDCLMDVGSCDAPTPPSPANQCQTFYEGLCPGPANCMCTLGEACGTRRNISEVRTAAGGCGGQCRQVAHNECGGDNDCLMDVGSCDAPTPPSPPGPAPNRDKIIACAEDWANQQIPYCQCNGPAECCGTCPYCGTFRCDCSGYVSYCLGLSYGYTTYTLPEVTHQISQGELLPGDIMLCQSDHVVFFAGWTDSSQTNYVCYQEPGCHTSGPHYAFESVVPYPFNWNPSCFLPFRKNGLDRNQSPVSNLAPKDVLMRALFNPASFPTKYAKEALEADAKVKAHIKTLEIKL